MTEIEQLYQTIESERAKFTQLRETFTQHQKSHQHLEKEVAKRKEREAELLALVERSEWEAKEKEKHLIQWERKLKDKEQAQASEHQEGAHKGAMAEPLPPREKVLRVLQEYEEKEKKTPNGFAYRAIKKYSSGATYTGCKTKNKQVPWSNLKQTNFVCKLRNNLNNTCLIYFCLIILTLFIYCVHYIIILVK